MRRLLPALLALLVASSAGAAQLGRIPGAKSSPICAAAGDYWPTETLALDATSAWIACKEQSRVVRVDLAKRKVNGSIPIGAPVIAVATGYGAVWALDSGGTLSRIDPASKRIVKRVALGAAAPYNIWIGASSVWVVDDSSGELIRVSPRTNRVVARISVGDGPADMVFAGTTAWVVDHRDRGLVRVDAATNRAKRLATLEADAPERLARLGGRLWITGRGTDLLEVDPATGALRNTYEIGAGGIDVVAFAGALWVPARNGTVDPTGLPTMDALRRVSPSGTVTTVVHAVGRVDVHGLASARGAVWLADTTSGALYRLPAG